MLEMHRVQLVIFLILLVIPWGAESAAMAQAGSRGMGFGGGGGPGGPGLPQERERYRPKQFAPTGPQVPVLEVRLKGNRSISESRIRGKLKTRAGRPLMPRLFRPMYGDCLPVACATT